MKQSEPVAIPGRAEPRRLSPLSCKSAINNDGDDFDADDLNLGSLSPLPLSSDLPSSQGNYQSIIALLLLADRNNNCNNKQHRNDILPLRMYNNNNTNDDAALPVW